MIFNNKKGGSDTSVEETGTLPIAVIVILIATSVFVGLFGSAFASDISKPTENGYYAIIDSIDKEYLNYDISVLNLDGYVIGKHRADCPTKCLCLYECKGSNCGKQVGKECFSKEVQMMTDDIGDDDDPVKIHVKISDDKIQVSNTQI